MRCNGSNSVHFGIDVVNMVIGGSHWGLLHYITTISRIYRGQSKKRKGEISSLQQLCVGTFPVDVKSQGRLVRLVGNW